MSSTMKIDLDYLMVDYSRHGQRRIYVRKGKKKIRLRSPEGSEDFIREYTATLDRLTGLPTGTTTSAAAPRGTLGWLAAQYFARGMGHLSKKSQTTRRRVIESALREPPTPESKSTMAICPIPQVNAAAIIMLMERKEALPGAANNRKKYISAMFGWGVKRLRDYVKSNPCRDAEKMAYATDGYHTWTVPEVQQYLERHPVGTKAALFLGLMLLTGARSEDVITFGRQHTRTGALRYVPMKTLYRRRKTVEKPILPLLAQIIAASPCGDMTFLVTDYGKPFSEKGIGNKMRDWCNQAGLPHCTAHGLKKAGATIAAENGATLHQLMAMFDWTTPSQAEPYTRAADQKKLAVHTAQLITFQIAPPGLQCPTEAKS